MNDFIRTHRTMPAVAVAIAVIALTFVLGRLSGDHAATSAQSPADPPATPSNRLKVAEASLKLMDVSVEAVTSGDLSAELNVPGSITAAPNGEAMVTARVAGTISRVTRRLGESVKAGEALAYVSSRDAAAIAAERRAAESKAALARSVLKRERDLFEQRITPRQDLESAEAQAEAAEADAARARIAAESAHVSADGQSLAVVSPIAGRITSAKASLGAYVEPDTVLFRVSDPRFVAVEAAVPAAEIDHVRAGDRAEVTATNGTLLKATVANVTPTVNAQTGAATATLVLADGQTPPAPGEFVKARIIPQAARGTDIVIPDEAVQIVDGRDVVFVRTDEGFRIQPVAVATRSAGRVAVHSGLQAGDRIATKNAFLLKAEATKSTEEDE
jgi:cobalt-zinc-cadmium efflux system membrane fusion protein